MAYGTRVAFEPIREANSATIGASYSAVGTAITDHCRLVSISNGTDAQVYISIDGIENHLRLAPNSFKLFDFSANKIRDDGLFLPSGTIFYAKQVSGAPTTGTLWIEVIHADGGV